jgi:hypothetical protein
MLLVSRNEAKGYEAIVDLVSAQQLKVLTVVNPFFRRWLISKNY